MSRKLEPKAVAARLAVLRTSYVAETVQEARARLADERPARHETLEQRATRCLGELRALDELARYLHRSSAD